MQRQAIFERIMGWITVIIVKTPIRPRRFDQLGNLNALGYMRWAVPIESSGSQSQCWNIEKTK